tara:strand:+ start:1396 stop:1671 length:276 start_codon:yes stop_codon:yes gene_type:complete
MIKQIIRNFINLDKDLEQLQADINMDIQEVKDETDGIRYDLDEKANHYDVDELVDARLDAILEENIEDILDNKLQDILKRLKQVEKANDKS